MKKTILAALAILMAGTSASFAVEKLKVAIPQRGFWDSTWVEFGEAAGFFKDAGLEVEVFYTEGGAQTIATVASGSVDIAMSNGILGAIGAYVKGGEATPYRIISAEMTGANELFWWVKADSPIKIAEGRRRQDHRVLVAGLVVESDPADAAQADRLQGQAHADRRRARNLHPTMTGQIDIGWSVVPFALKDVNDGKIRIVARASEAKELQDQTIRANLASVNSLKTKREAIAKFMQVIQKSIDWAYSQPAGDRNLRQEHEGHAGNRQAGGRRVLPEVGHADRRDQGPRSFAPGCARFQVHRVAEDAAGHRRAVRHRLQAEISRGMQTPSLWLD